MKKLYFSILTVLFGSFAVYSATVNIAISGSAFSPNAVTLNVGDVVVWTNNDAFGHSIEFLTVPATASSTGSATLSQTQTFSYTVTVSGDYSYRCGIHHHMLGSFTTNTATGLFSKSKESDILVFPNPVFNSVIIKADQKADRVKISDAIGVVLKEEFVQNGTNEIDLSSLKQGIYILTFYNKEELVGIRRVVKK